METAATARRRTLGLRGAAALALRAPAARAQRVTQRLHPFQPAHSN